MIAAVTRLRAAARVCWFSKPRSRKRPSRRKATARARLLRSEEHTSELQSLMRISYAVFCLKKKKTTTSKTRHKSSSDNKATTHKHAHPKIDNYQPYKHHYL